MLERLHDERRRDVVREVGDELRRRRAQRRYVDRECVAPDERDVRPVAESIAKGGLERPVDLDRVHEAHVVGEVTSEDAEARADLEHDVVRPEGAQPTDDAHDVLVDEEVLAEGLLGRDGHGSANAVAALACVAAASSSRVSPRTSASARRVWTTLAGSFGVPLTG